VPSDGTAVRRIAVQFAYSEQVWPARVQQVDPTLDAAVIKVSGIIGDVPFIQRFNTRADTMAAGSPVVMIGFPGGGVTQPSGAGRTLISPVVGVGSMTASGATQLEVEGYGSAGSSGGPVFDRDGAVIGVVFGGGRGGTGNFVVAVSAAAVAKLIGRR